jgi:RsiW-degrading membrane proteinase PrsW (M82 family)
MDKLEKEPKGLLVRLFLCGLLSTGLTFLLSYLMSYYMPIFNDESTDIPILLVNTFIGIALVEEFCKWIFLGINTWNNKEFNHTYDGIVYAVFVSLGFATIENLLYIFTSENVLLIAIIRGLLAVPGHVFNGVFMGYFYSLAKKGLIEKNKFKYYGCLFLSLLIPTLTHGFYDFCLMAGLPILLFTFVIYIICLYIFAFVRIAKSSKHDEAFIKVYCRHCGAVKEGLYCGVCGK